MLSLVSGMNIIQSRLQRKHVHAGKSFVWLPACYIFGLSPHYYSLALRIRTHIYTEMQAIELARLLLRDNVRRIFNV
jgi:hypothetical protein